MKILHVNDVANVGYTLVKELVKLGVDAKLLVVMKNDSAVLRSKMSNEDFILKVRGVRRIRYFTSILRLLRRGSWDLIHMHYLRTYAYMTSFLRKSFVIHVHGSDIRFAYSSSFYEGVVHRIMKLFALKKASRVLASTPNLVPLINSFSPATNALYLPNPVDTKYFEPANAQKLSMGFTHLHDGVDLLITAPTVVDFSTKGSGILLKALSKIKKPPNYRLVIIKHGQDFKKLLELVVKLGLRSKVKIIDPVPNELMPGLYGISDIVVAAISKQEVLGMTALESMACGTLTLNTWSRKYYGDTGFPLLPFGTEALKNLIEHLISDQDLRANVARAQLEWVKANHSSEVIAKLLIQIYEDVLQADSANTSLA